MGKVRLSEKRIRQFKKITSAFFKDIYFCLFYPGNSFQKSLIFAVEGEVTSAQFSLS